MFKRAALIALLATSLSGLAMAEEVTIYRAGDLVDPAAVARILGGNARVLPPGVRTRSIRLLDDAPSAAAPAPAGSALVAMNGPTAGGLRAGPTSLSLPVQFGFDSTEILPEARMQLDAVAEGIKMVPPTLPVVIEGHTDARGSDEYNQTLSERRAQSVKRYLVSIHGIDPARLRAVGHGEMLPIDPANPNGPVNRRVQFRAG